MAVSRSSNKNIYINREIDFIIEEKIKEETPKLLLLHGQGGVGKSTLLKKFLSYDAKEIPTVLISLQDTKSTNFVDILLSRDITIIKNCKNFEKVRKIIIEDDPCFFASVLEAYGSEMSTQLKQIENESYGLVVGAFYDIMKLVSKFFRRSYEKQKKEIAHNIEFSLVDALLKDFKNYGLFMVDTLEKTKNIDIKSKIEFQDTKFYKSHQDKSYQFRHYINGLVKLLLPKSTCIIAGRNSKNELNMEIDSTYTEELLENFDLLHINKFFKRYIENGELELSLPTTKQLNKIMELTNGNPLKISLFLEMAKEYSSWEEFDFGTMEERVKEDEQYGLIFYMTNRVLSHLEEHKDIWKLVIPRVLTQDIQKLLFKDEKILEKFIDVGLAKKGTGQDWKRYYIHDDVYQAIVAYYEREFKDEFSSWHDTEVVAELHMELIEFYEKHGELYGVNGTFEGCYHKMMLREGFEREFEVKREKFISFTLGALLLSSNKKMALCQDWEKIEKSEINQYIQDLKNEKDRANISSELYDRFSKDLALGVVDSFEDINYLTKLSKDNEFKNDYSIFYVSGNFYFKKGEYDKAIEAYEKAVEVNPKNDGTYNNMGSAYGNKEEYDKAIEAYQKAIEINPKDDDVYYNMGIAYGNKEEYDKAIETYQKAIEINPKHEMAYNNMGNVYNNIKEYDKAIKAYEKAVEINPKTDVTYYNIGNTYTDKKEYDKAIKAYKKAVEINSKYDKVYYNMGNAYCKGEKYDESIEAYKKAVEINPKYDKAYYNMGNVYYSLGHFDEAIKALSMALYINPNKNEAYTNIFELQLIKKQSFDQVLERKYVELFQNQKETFIHYEMLMLLQDIVQNQELNLEGWVQKYRSVSLGSWSFDELHKWIDRIEDEVVQVKLREALEVFEGHG